MTESNDGEFSQSKFFLLSKTVQGLLIVAVGVIFAIKGASFDSVSQSWWSSEIAAILSAVGLILAALGRISASTKIHFIPKFLRNDTTPQLFFLCITLGLMGATLCALPGCPSIVTPTTQPAPAEARSLLQQEQAYNEVMHGLQAARPFMDDNTAVAIEQVRALAWDYLGKAKAANDEGRPVDTAAYIDLFNKALDKLKASLTRTTATQPKGP